MKLRHTRRSHPLLLACVLSTSCGLEPATPSSGPMPIFDLAETAAPEGFYDYPVPSDVRLTDTGAPDISGFYEPTGTTLIWSLCDAVERDIRGFSPLAGAYFRFSEPLDPTGLPASSEESMAPGAAVFLIDIDASSPHRGERWPAEVSFHEDGGRYWRPNTLVVRPPLAMPLRPATRYAAVVTTAVRGSDGETPPVPEPAFADLLGDAAPAGREDEWTTYRDLARWAEDEGVTDGILVATVFTTADHLGDMRRLRAWVHENVEAPRATDWELVQQPDGTSGPAVYMGRFEMMDFLAGEPPYTAQGDGVILFEPDGSPRTGRMVSVRFALTVPAGDPPPGGWPLALYAHGAGGSCRSFLDDEGIWAAEVGVAMISMDNPMNGERDPAGGDFVETLIALALQHMNVGAGRDMYRHGIADQVQLARLATGGLTVPAEVSHTGTAIAFDTGHLAFVSHSMGSQIGAMLIAVEPDIRSAFLSEGGGGAAAAFLLRKSNGIDIEGGVALALGVDLDREPLDADHPVIGLLLQTLLDPGDPLDYALGAIREPAGEPVHVLMTEGLEDDQTIPVTIESLAAAYGLPIVEPVAHESAAHALWGIAPTGLPATGNVDVGPSPVTGGVLQFPGHGHYALYENDDAQRWYRGWLESAAAGTPTIIE